MSLFYFLKKQKGKSGSKDSISNDKDNLDQICIWEALEEPEVDIDAIEMTFSQKDSKNIVSSPVKVAKENKAQTFTALDGKRTQAVGILMGSMKIGL